MDQAKLVELGILIAMLVLSLGLHEYAHALVANLRGDSTAKDLGRMTPNPIAHIDPVMTIAVPAILYMTAGFIFGGAKPVPVVPSRLKHPLRDMMLVAIAGPATNLLLAVISMALWKASIYSWGFEWNGYENSQLLPRALYMATYFNILLAVFNMIPIPPLDGSRVMAYFLPQQLRESYVSLERIGMLLVIGFVFFFPPGLAFLKDGMAVVWDLLHDLTGGSWRR